MSTLHTTVSLQDIQRCQQEYEDQLVELRFVQQNIQKDRERCQSELKRQIHDLLPQLLQKVDADHVRWLDALLHTDCLTKCREQFGMTLAQLHAELDRLNQKAPLETRQQRMTELSRLLAQQIQEHKALSQQLSIYQTATFQHFIEFIDQFGLSEPQGWFPRLRQKCKGVLQQRRDLMRLLQNTLPASKNLEQHLEQYRHLVAQYEQIEATLAQTRNAISAVNEIDAQITRLLEQVEAEEPRFQRRLRREIEAAIVKADLLNLYDHLPSGETKFKVAILHAQLAKLRLLDLLHHYLHHKDILRQNESHMAEVIATLHRRQPEMEITPDQQAQLYDFLVNRPLLYRIDANLRLTLISTLREEIASFEQYQSYQQALDSAQEFHAGLVILGQTDHLLPSLDLIRDILPIESISRPGAGDAVTWQIREGLEMTILHQALDGIDDAWLDAMSIDAVQIEAIIAAGLGTRYGVDDLKSAFNADSEVHQRLRQWLVAVSNAHPDKLQASLAVKV